MITEAINLSGMPNIITICLQESVLFSLRYSFFNQLDSNKPFEEMNNLLTNQLTQCASVYVFVNNDNIDFYVIHCLICNEEYSNWTKFLNHLQTQHLQNLKQGLYEIANDEDIKAEYLDEEIQLDTTDNLLGECEIKIECLEDDDNIYTAKETKSIADDKYLEEYGYWGVAKNKERHCLKSLVNNDEGYTKTLKPINNCFFRLCSTDNNIMLKFIELLRNEPCQWDYKHSHFSNKNKRFESTLILAEELNKHFNLHVTAQGTRTSVLSLMRWFESEYIRLLNCQQNGYEFVSTHQEYFEKLLEFLPHEHLKPMSCDECSKQFKSEHLLMAHKHKYHNGQVPFLCRFCGHGFIHRSSHKMHENRHIKIHVWPCSNCTYQAASKSDYIKHLATHSPQQPFKCSICGLAYKTRTNLNVHMKSHGLPEYECEICQKKFYEKYRYKRHIWLHEESELSQKSIDNFTCEICGRRFTSCKTLAKHKLVHVQENYKIGGPKETNLRTIDVIAYFCDYCSLEFLYKEAYEAHMFLKHKIKCED